jgi:hypothetical protein
MSQRRLNRSSAQRANTYGQSRSTSRLRTTQRRETGASVSDAVDDLGTLQRRAGNQAVSDLLRSETARAPEANGVGGTSLDPALRRTMERRFGADFSAVRIHADAAAQQKAAELDAAAVTEGTNIYFAAGKFAPGTAQGMQRLAHELAHVHQQGRMQPRSTYSASRDLEAEARSAGLTAVSGSQPISVHPGSAPAGEPQADPAGEFEHHFRGKAGERGIGVLYVRGWSQMTKTQKDAVIASARDMDVQASNILQRRSVDAASRSAANSVARLARPALGLGAGEAAGHTPDVVGGGSTLGPIIGLPKKVNSSFGGQWARYQNGFGFTGVSVVDLDGGTWIYQSLALEHAPPAAPRGALPPAPRGASGTPKPAAPPPPASRTGTPGGDHELHNESPFRPPSGLQGTHGDPHVPSRPPLEIGPSARNQAKVEGSLGLLMGAHYILELFAEKAQRDAFDAAMAKQAPEIQKLNEEGKGVTVIVEYTRSRQHPDAAVSPVAKFEGLRWQTGNPASVDKGTLRGAGQEAEVKTMYFPPTKEGASKTDEGAAQYRLNELWQIQHRYQRGAERMAREGTVGRWLLSRKQDKLDIGPVYEARAHLTSAQTAIAQGRFEAAQGSMNSAEKMLNEMRAKYVAYSGKTDVE